MSAHIKEKGLISEIRNKFEIQKDGSGSNSSTSPSFPAKKKLQKCLSANPEGVRSTPPKPAPYREYQRKKTSDVPMTTAAIEANLKSSDWATRKEESPPLLADKVGNQLSRGKVGDSTRMDRKVVIPREYEKPLPLKQIKQGEGNISKPQLPKLTLKSSHSETEIQRKASEEFKSKVPPSGSQNNISLFQKETAETSPKAAGVRNLISQFNKSKDQIVTNQGDGDKETPKSEIQKRNTSATGPSHKVSSSSDVAVGSELWSRSVKVKDGSKVIHIDSRNRMEQRSDSGFSEAESPNFDNKIYEDSQLMNGKKTTNDAESIHIRHVGESEEDKKKRSFERKGLVSDGALLDLDMMKSEEDAKLATRSQTLDSEASTGYVLANNPGVTRPTLNYKDRPKSSQKSDDVTSLGYLKILPKDYRADIHEEAIRTTHAESQKLPAKKNEKVNMRINKRQFPKGGRKFSDPMIKVLNVTLDEMATKRASDDMDINSRERSNIKRPMKRELLQETSQQARSDDDGAEYIRCEDLSSQSQNKSNRSSKLLARFTRVVRGKKEDQSLKDTRKSQSAPVKPNNVITSRQQRALSSNYNKSTPDGIAYTKNTKVENIQNPSSSSPSIQIDPYVNAWKTRMDLHGHGKLSPLVERDLYAYAKMPFRRNVHVCVKYAGLRALKQTNSCPLSGETQPLNPAIEAVKKNPIQPPQSSTSSPSDPPPIVPKTRSIKRSILVKSGFDISRVKDWNKSLSDLLYESDDKQPGIKNFEHPLQKKLMSCQDTSLKESSQEKEEECLFPVDPPPLPPKRSNSFSESPYDDVEISRQISSGLKRGCDPYYNLLKRPSFSQHMLSTSVEVLLPCPDSESQTPDNSSLRNRAQSMPVDAVPPKPRYENLDGVLHLMMTMKGEHESRTLPKGSSFDEDYIRMERSRSLTSSRYMNILSLPAISEGQEGSRKGMTEEVPDYIKMSSANWLDKPAMDNPDFNSFISPEDQEYVLIPKDEELTKMVESLVIKDETAPETVGKDGRYMNWVDITEDFFQEKTDYPEFQDSLQMRESRSDSDLESSVEVKSDLVIDGKKNAPSIYSHVMPSGWMGIETIPSEEEEDKEEKEAQETETRERAESLIINESESGTKGDRYMNINNAELIFLNDNIKSMAEKRPSQDKLPMPSPRKASLTRRRQLNYLHPNIPISNLPPELQEITQNQSQPKLVFSDTALDPPSSPVTKAPGGLCVIASACEEFTHVGGVLKPKEECGIYIEIPSDAIKKKTVQKIWFVACYDTTFPGDSWQKLGTLARNSSDETNLLDEDFKEREQRSSVVSPLLYVGPANIELLKPLKIHMPHCVSFEESSLRYWLEAKCYEMPIWAKVCQRVFFHTPPKCEQSFKDTRYYKPNIVFQLRPTNFTIKSSHLGWFKLCASAFRGTVKAAKRMFVSVFQRRSGDYSVLLPTIQEDEGHDEDSNPKDIIQKTEILVIAVNDLPYAAEVIQWLLERGVTKYACIERYMPFRYCANGRDCEIILHGESSKTPIQTTSIPFGNLWRMKKIGEGWQSVSIKEYDRYKGQIITFSMKQGDVARQLKRHIHLNE